jgi:hypothetical protein
MQEKSFVIPEETKIKEVCSEIKERMHVLNAEFQELCKEHNMPLENPNKEDLKWEQYYSEKVKDALNVQEQLNQYTTFLDSSSSPETAVILSKDERNEEELYRYPAPKSTFEIESAWKNTARESFEIENKNLSVIDGFFSEKENQSLTQLIKTLSFPETIYASPEAVIDGEIPAKKLHHTKAEQLLLQPPPPLEKLQGLFYLIGEKIKAHTFSTPKKTCIPSLTCTGSITNNFVTHISKETSRLGIHKDYDPEETPQYLLPKIFEPNFYPASFVNGSENRPYLLTCMLYIHSEYFNPDLDGMGTVFFDKKNTSKYVAKAQQGRLIFFEGNIQHSLQEALREPEDEKWRLSFVWLLAYLPKNPNSQSLKEAWTQLLSERSIT